MTLAIPKSAEFYVRSALNYRLLSGIDNIKKAEAVLANDEAPPLAREMAQGLINTERQWMREAIPQFKELANAIRPDSDLLDFEA